MPKELCSILLARYCTGLFKCFKQTSTRSVRRTFLRWLIPLRVGVGRPLKAGEASLDGYGRRMLRQMLKQAFARPSAEHVRLSFLFCALGTFAVVAPSEEVYLPDRMQAKITVSPTWLFTRTRKDFARMLS